MRVFHSKHQKLILRCYPPGKAADKKPNSSELSYLLYYASTRRVKLEKVSLFLTHKTDSDCYHNRVGNIQVTLSILAALIERCADNLSVFASYVCMMLKRVLLVEDLQVYKTMIDVHGILCSKMESGIVAGDSDFHLLFNEFSLEFLKVAQRNLKVEGPNRLEWKMILLCGCRNIFRCLGYHLGTTRKYLSICIPILMGVLSDGMDLNSLSLGFKASAGSEEVHRLTRAILAKAATQTEENRRRNLDNDAVTGSDINEEALQCFKVLFNTNLTTQIYEATEIVTDDFIKRKVDTKWASVFLELCTTWTPVQLRFVILTALLEKSSNLAQNVNNNNAEVFYSLQNRYARAILGLVSSEVNMIGLSISDVIQQVLLLQSDVILEKAKFLNSGEVKTLTQLYSDCICNLSTHIYYFDQVPDSIQEIFVRIDAELHNSALSLENKFGLFDLVSSLLDDIMNIFKKIKTKSSNISRNHVTLENWSISLPLLSTEDGYTDDELKLLLPLEQIVDLQSKYLKIFEFYLDNEMIEVLEDDVGLGLEADTFLNPDYNHYISRGENFISHFLIYVDKFISSVGVNIQVLKSLARCMFKMLKSLGINFVHNFIPFFLQWISTPSQERLSTRQVIKDTLAYVLMFHSLVLLDKQYDLEYCCHTAFFKKICEDVGRRKVNGMWYNELEDGYEVKTPADRNFNYEHTDLSGSLGKNDLEDFVIGNKFTLSWIDPHKHLELDSYKQDSYAFKKVINPDAINENLSLQLSELVTTGNNALGLTETNQALSIQSGIAQVMDNNDFRDGTNENSSPTSLEETKYNAPKAANLKAILDRKFDTDKDERLQSTISSMLPTGKKDIKSILADLHLNGV